MRCPIRSSAICRTAPASVTGDAVRGSSASTLPIGAAFIMVFAPPEGLTGVAASQSGWRVAIIGFYSAMTVFFVPHLSLGAELSEQLPRAQPPVRCPPRLLHVRVDPVADQLLSPDLRRSRRDARWSAPSAPSISRCSRRAVMVVADSRSLSVSSGSVADYQGRVNQNPFRMPSATFGATDHARLLIVVTFIEHVGSAAIGALTLYVAQYVIGAPLWAPIMILCYMIPSSFSVPLWIPSVPPLRQGSAVDVLDDPHRRFLRIHVRAAVPGRCHREGAVRDAAGGRDHLENHLHLRCRGIRRAGGGVRRNAVPVHPG